MNHLNINILLTYSSMQRNRPPPLTEPERNAESPLPTVMNSKTTQICSPSGQTIVAFLSEPVKGKPPVAVAGISEKSVLPLALNLRTT